VAFIYGTEGKVTLHQSPVFFKKILSTFSIQDTPKPIKINHSIFHSIFIQYLLNQIAELHATKSPDKSTEHSKLKIFKLKTTISHYKNWA
jgi:hypothetical protein